HLIEGRHLEKENIDTCIVNDNFFRANNLKIGERIEVTVDSKRQSLKITGTALSPEYVYAIRNAQELIPNPEKFGIIWVNREWSENAFNMSGYYNEIVGETYDSEKIDEIFTKSENILKSYGVY